MHKLLIFLISLEKSKSIEKLKITVFA